jgi:asparagine synthase (glutamine-hydrolysing)
MQAISARPYKVILAGMGGDEVLGGVPTPDPELATLLMTGRLVKFISRSIDWCLPNRLPLVRMMSGVLASTVRLYCGERINFNSIPPWINKDLLALSSMNHQDYSAIRNRHDATPLAICNGSAWWAILETLPHLRPGILARHEYRYPYLDRDLVEFLFAIPREQLVQPGRRRYLMRRALRGIVPEEILERRRKAFISRAPLLALGEKGATIQKLITNSLAANRSWIDYGAFNSVLSRTVETNDPRWVMALTTTIALELWLRIVHHHLTLEGPEQRHKITLTSELSGQDPRWANTPV